MPNFAVLKSMQIIISCGGGGTRLWPVSTEEHPKQLIPLLDDESLMLKTYNRIRKSFSPDQIWVTVNKAHLELVKTILPKEFNLSHIITEPVKRDTFAAISITAAIIASKTSKEEPLIFIPSDDWIEDETDILKVNEGLVSIGKSLENKEYDCVTVGIKPKSASTQLGYLELDSSEIKFGDIKMVKSFKEKPYKDLANQYFESGNYLWHKHNPSLTYTSLIRNIKIYYPELITILDKVYSSGSTSISDFEAFPKLSIDYAILEKAEKIGVLPLDVNWNDVGTWDTVFSLLPELDQKQQIQVDGENNKVKLDDKELKIAFVGVSNLLVVQSPDGLLIIDPRHPGGVKTAAEHFGKL